jgi:cytochrome c oxidase subunit 1
MFYLLWSLGYGERAPDNPWNATGLEWQTPSPPAKKNFERTPVVTERPYSYSPVDGSFVPQGVQHV